MLIVTTTDNVRYVLERAGPGLRMDSPGGSEHVKSYGDAVWRLGRMVDGAIVQGPRGSVASWRAAVRATFPQYAEG